MTTTKHVALTLAITLCALLANVQAQTARVSTVNVTSEGERVKIAAQGDVSEMRIEVADEQGDIVFQSGAITGQQLDWNMKDTQGERVAAGTYLVTVTFRNASGKVKKRVEQVTVDEEEKAQTKTQDGDAPEAVQATVSATTPLTANKIPKFKTASSSAVTLTNSIITESAGKIGIGTTAPVQTLQVNGITSLGAPGSVYGYLVAGSSPGPYPTIGFNAYGTSYRAGVTGYGGIFQFQNGDGKLIYYTSSKVAAGAAPASTARFVIDKDGKVSIGTTDSRIGKLNVDGGNGGLAVEATGNIGLRGQGTFDGVRGVSTHTGAGAGISGQNTSGGFAGYFVGKVEVTGNLKVGSCTGCTMTSDQNLKANFSTVNPRLVLDRLSAIPIKSWNYKSDEPTVRHIGPMAQDFRTAFNLGVDDKHIDMIDANGVTMASIQALYQMMQEKDRQIETLTRKVEQQQSQLNQVKRTIKRKRTARR